MVLASVEEVALSHYLRSGWSIGLHSENSLPLTLFGLLLRDALFAPVPGQLGSAVQDAPVDLWDARRFYARRRLQIDETLSRVRAGQAVRLLHAAHAAHWGSPVVGVTWDRFSLSMLCNVADGLGGAAVAGICAALANDYACWSHGFPDLLLLEPGHPTAPLDPPARPGGDLVPSAVGFNSGCGAAASTDGSSKPSGARLKLVEVKSPGDRLSDAQVAWIGLLLEHGVPVEVCRVKPSAD
jgi:Fanconi-associated nuclease 1